MSGPDPNQPIGNVSPVVSSGTQQAAPGAAPAYIAPPLPVFSPMGDYTGVSAPAPVLPSAPPPVGGGVMDAIKAPLRMLQTYAQPPAPATGTDAVAAPQPPTQAAGHSAAGTPMSTYNSGEQHPQTHTLEDFVNANRHLTLHDIKSLMPGITPSLGVHNQIMGEAYQGLVSQRDQAFKNALALENRGDLAGAQKIRETAAEQHITNMMRMFSAPYAQQGAFAQYNNGTQ